MQPPSKRQRTDDDSNAASTSQSHIAHNDVQVRLARLEDGLKALVDRPTTINYNGCQIFHNQPAGGAAFAVQPGSTPQHSLGQPGQHCSSGDVPQTQHTAARSQPFHQIGPPIQPELPDPYQQAEPARSVQQSERVYPPSNQAQENLPYPPTPPYQVPAGGHSSQQAHRSAVYPPKRYHPSPIPNGIILPSKDQMIASLSEDNIRELLSHIVSLDTTGIVHAGIVNEYVQQKVRAGFQPNEFDSFSKTAWHYIHFQYASSGGGKQSYHPSATSEGIVCCVKEISAKVDPSSSYTTKLSALETLCRIANMIIRSDETRGEEIRDMFVFGHVLSDTMIKIVQDMPLEERLSAGLNVSEPGNGTLLEKMEWVSNKANRSAIDGLLLGRANVMLRGGHDSGDMSAIAGEGIESDGEDEDEIENEDLSDPEEEEEEAEEDGQDDDDRTDDGDSCDVPPRNFIAFDACAAEVHCILNQRSYSRELNRRSSELREAYADIQGEIELIRNKIREPLSLDSKGQAIVALLGIGSHIFATSRANEIQYKYQNDTEISKLVRSIIISVEREERGDLFARLRLKDRIQRLISETQGRGIHCFDTLQRLELLWVGHA